MPNIKIKMLTLMFICTALLFISLIFNSIEYKDFYEPSVNIIDDNISILHMDDGNVKVYSTQERVDSKTFYKKIYEIYNGDSVILGRLFASKQRSSVCVDSFDVDSKVGNVIYFNASSKEWQAMKLKETLVQSSCLILQTEDGSEYLIYTPKIYKHLENYSLEYFGEIDG